MRLRSTRNILENEYDELDLTYIQRNTSPVTYNVDNFIELKKSIRNIESTGLFEDLISKIKELDFYDQFSETITLQSNQFNSLKSLTDELRQLVDSLIITLNNLIPVDNEYTLSIKIPNPTSFKEISETTKSLDLIFNQTLLHPSLNGSVEILNFDMGSYWIDVLINGGAAVLHFVAALSWGGAVTYKKIQDGLLVKEQVRELKISNNSKEELSKGIEESENTLAENEAQFIANQFYTDFSSEDVGRIKFALKEMAKLFLKGGEIHLSLKAANDIKEEFPKMNQINTISSKIKQIPEKTKKKGK